MTHSRLSLALTVSAVALLPGVAMAQDPDAPATRVDDIVVTAAPYGVARQATNIAVDVLDEEALTTAPSGSLGDVLNGLPGVRTTAFAAGAGRPVIRGLAGPRVQVLTNGLGLIDASSLSPDHQVAADPGEATRIEVLRGPQTLAFGGSAIGGVVNVIDGRIADERPEGGADGRVWAQTSTVDDGLTFGARGAFSAGPLVFTVDGLRREAGDYDIPVPAESRRQLEAEGETYEDTGGTTLENSFVDLSAFGAGVSWIGDWGFLGGSVKRTETDYGVPGHEHEHEPLAPPHDEEPVTIGLEQTRYDVRGELRLPSGPFARLRGGAAYADYTHTEFEGDEVGTVFTSEGVEGRLELVQVRRRGWDGAIGVQGLKRDFDAQGDEAYVPATDISELGVYTLQRLDYGGWGLEGGLRFDSRELDSVAGTRDFSTVSGSIGAYFKPTDALFLGLSVSRNGRAPTEAELFADGPHVATRAYEVGDADLGEEEVTSLEGALHWDRGPFTVDLHVFNADYDGFIDLVPTGVEDVDSELEIFQYVQTDATFRGLEVELAYRAWERGTDSLTLELGYDTVRGETDLGPPARIPPWSLSGRAELEWGPWTVRGQVRHVGEQTRVAAFELPTDAYTTADLYVGWSPREDGLILFAEARNLTDEEVREHTSFLKDLAPSPGRNLRVGAAYRF
ncbi:TonB-dependent receptor domain-containing protein [Brevundimonas fluminis]|jgi:iron complex outermembrane recepter protein|uniref:TonB-dependent receptor domain-containing protein n=1 Tax=Brevundimonas fluminis TaxID=2487274 RepID=UPI000F656A6C|nr:TonB-dependent receptor [Brevundimonas fluminis]